MQRILHVVENLDKGAVENWLVNIFLESRKTKPNQEWTFYCILGKKGRLDDKVVAAGGKIIHSPFSISEKFRFLKYFRQTLRKGRYDIIHSHHDYLSGFYLLATAGLSFKKRILHIHNTDKALPVGNALLHRMLLPVFGRFAVHFSDLIIGISKDTLQEFTGSRPFVHKRTTVLYYGVNFSAFSNPSRPEAIRNELSIPPNGKIILFVGRMNTFKNPAFVIDILCELAKRRNDVYALFVGKGEQEEIVQKKRDALGLDNKVRLLGWRNDIPAIMQASDIFIFPRIEYPKEGLGLVVVEAQAAGLPMLLTQGIVEDAIVIDELAHILPLADNPKEWADKVCSILDQQKAIDQKQAFDRMMQSHFELAKATTNLLGLYEN